MAIRIYRVPGWEIRIQQFRSTEKTWVRTVFFVDDENPRRSNYRASALTLENMVDLQRLIGQAVADGLDHATGDFLLNTLDIELMKRLP